MDKSKQIIAKVEHLPALPGVVTQVLEITQDVDFDLGRLVEVVSLDPGVTANVLRRANSAFFGLGSKSVTLDQALNRLGVENLVDMVLSAGVIGMLDQDLGGYGFQHGYLWRHSLTSALFGRWLAKRADFANAAEIYTAALLHDVGKLILSTFVAEEFSAIQQLVVRERWPVCQAEKEVLGVDHASLGGLAAKKWHLADTVQTAIRYHHQPGEASPCREQANLVALANYFANALSPDPQALLDRPYLSPATLFDLGLSAKSLEDFTPPLQALLQRAEPLFTMVGV